VESEYDVVIVGAGVAGALAAYKLAAAKLKVLLLEAGEAGPERLELVGNYARADVKSSNSPYKGGEGDVKAPYPDPVKLSDYYEQTTDSKRQFQSTYLRRVGGTTWHWLGNVPRFVPHDFQLRSRYGVGVDWPISYEDLEEWYGEAEHELGVSGDHEEWDGLLGAKRSRPFPMSKIWLSYSDTVAARDIDGLEADGLKLKVLSTPQARNSQPYQNRPPCAGNSICVPLCPIQAKYDATVHVRLAQQAGAVLRKRSVVVRLEVDDDRHVQRVVYRRWDDGQEVMVKGRVVVLAAHAIETPKLLLLSQSERAPQGVANSSDQVGRNLMDHLQGTATARAKEPLFPFRGPPTTAGIDVFRDGPFRSERSAFRMSLGNDGWQRKGAPLSDVVEAVKSLKLFGPELVKRLEDRVTHQFRISYSTEMLPDANSRVTLSDALDSSGIRRPAISFAGVPKYNQEGFKKAWEVIGKIFDVMGATERSVPSDLTKFSGAGHIMGTCRMGDDPKTSVVDRECRAHDHPNLFIIGSSTFPTCGTANPTLTVAALALRAAAAVEKQLAGG
jgi:choline dehydrogenase-like flavoprotein